MFGYIKPNRPYLYIKDDTLYKSLYCGVCVSIKKHYGQTARLVLSYDVAFLSAVAHNIIGKDVDIKKKKCIAHPFVSRQIAQDDELTEMLAALNILLAAHKIKDDIIDAKKGKAKKLFLNASYKKARKKYPELDKVIEDRYNELRACELNNDEILDRVSEPFAIMLKDISHIVLGNFSTESSDNLFYFIGKWIYLIDALDDYDKDYKKGEYNPFRCAYKSINFKELLKEYKTELDFIFNDIQNEINQSFYNIKFGFNADLIENISVRGLPEVYKNITEKKK